MAEDPVLVAVAAWTRANSFQAAGDYEHGLALLDAARATLETARPDEGTRTTVVLGSLHLRAVTLASRAKDASATNDQLARARQLAQQLPEDVSYHHLTFGAGNTVIHEVAARVELDQPQQAVELANRFAPPQGIAATRAGHHHLDAARAYLAVGDRTTALQALHKAREVAPEQTRHHPMARESARVLVSLHRRSNPELTQLATWLGLTG